MVNQKQQKTRLKLIRKNTKGDEMKDVIAKLVAEQVSEKLFSEDSKEKVVKALNDNINIPILNEKTEEKIFEAIWESVEDILKKVVLK